MAMPGGITKAPGGAAPETACAEPEAAEFAVPPEEVASGAVVSSIGGGVAEEEDSDAGDFSRADMLVRDGF
jgi:hypothetical protein